VPRCALWYWATGLTQYVKTHVGISVHVCVKYRYGLWTQFLLYVSFFDGNELVGWCCGKLCSLWLLKKKHMPSSHALSIFYNKTKQLCIHTEFQWFIHMSTMDYYTVSNAHIHVRWAIKFSGNKFTKVQYFRHMTCA